MARFKQDEDGDPFGGDPWSYALRSEMSNYVNPTQGSVAPDPAPSGGGYNASPVEQARHDEPGSTNESYQQPSPQPSNQPAAQSFGQPSTDYTINNQTGATYYQPAGSANTPENLAAINAMLAKLGAPAPTGPTATSDPIAFIRQWQQANPASQGIGPLSDAISKQFPGVSRFMYGQTPSNNELLINGQKFKVLGAEDSPNTAYWYQGGEDGGGGTARAPVQRSGGGFGNLDQGAGVGSDLINSLVSRLLGGGGLFAGIGGQSQNQDPFRAQLMDALSKLVQEGQQPVGDVSASPQAKAFQRASTRNAEKQRSRLAEQRGAQGLLRSGTFEQDKNAIDQQTAAAQSGYEAQLANTILEDRKQKLEYALTTGAGYITNEQQLQLQRELQGINAALAQTSIQLQLAQALLGNQRFYDQLGFNIGQAEQGGNQVAGNAILGG